MIGKTIGHYRIVEKIGAGGMGVVYKALDTHLERFVAIKVLPQEKVADPKRKVRFVREAKASSALNHPNIVHIYDIDQAEGVHYIAMEYVQGKTLDRLIEHHGLGVGVALKYAVQIADALAKAHSAGIVHRDLKPSNIIVNEDGVVKILDFGLAKLTEQPSSDDAATTDGGDQQVTEEGLVVGTASYMSPEQAEGKSVDARSDIFSFGSVLYEMVTGHKLFKGESTVATLSAIVNQEPVTTITTAIPTDLDKLISRCLRKDPARRFQHMDDMKIALDELKEESDSMKKPLGSVRTGTRPWLLICAAGFVLIAVVAVGWRFLRPVSKPTPPAGVVPFTSYPGNEINPVFSPDGSAVAFSWNGEKEDNYDIYIQLISGGLPRRLTTDPAPDTRPAWSPDNSQIAFCRGSEIYLISPNGGPERKLTDSRQRILTLSWTPDGKSIAFPDQISDQELAGIYLFSLITRTKQRLTTTVENSWGDVLPAFSPDGKILAFARNYYGTVSELCMMDMAGGEVHQLTNDGAGVASTAWIPDGKEIFFGSQRRRSSTMSDTSLWRMDARNPSGVGVQPVPGTQNGSGLAISRSTPTRLVFEQSAVDWNVYQLDITEAGTAAGEPRQVSPSTRQELAPRFSPDGKRIALISDRSGTEDIWICDRDGSRLYQVSLGKSGGHRWSPDGSMITFDFEGEIYVVSSEGGEPRKVNTVPGPKSRPSWSRDGRWLFFTLGLKVNPQIWKVPAGGGEAIQLTRNGGVEALAGPDGKLLYYIKSWDQVGMWSVPVDGGPETMVSESVRHSYWEVVQEGVYFVRWDNESPRGGEVRFYNFQSRQTTRVTSIERLLPSMNTNFSASRDGRHIAWSQSDRGGSDLMLIENFR